MKFKMLHNFYDDSDNPVFFTEDTPPDWLTSKNTIRGSTMDMRWFWQEHVLTLPVGGSIETDFRTIHRIE